MVAIGALVLAVVVLFALMLIEGGPDDWLETEEAEARLTETLGNVELLKAEQDDDPLMGPCVRCGAQWSQHPGGYCPDAVGADGLVEVRGPIFQPEGEL